MINSYVHVANLYKSFGKQTIIRNISADFDKGKIHGLVGRNGSGKTVLLKLICGLMYADKGNVTVDGVTIGKDSETPKSVGAIIETPGFLPYVSGFQNLKMLAGIKSNIDAPRIKQTIRQVGLDCDSKKHVGKYSLGMRQRLGIAQAIMEDPALIILDEPMNGLDKQGAIDMRRLFLHLRDEGKTLLLASHNQADIDQLCDTVHEMDAGKIEQVK